MIIQVLLIISIILQLSAVVVAVGLTRQTKFNSSWILFTIALSCMVVMRFGEYIQQTDFWKWRLPDAFFVWAGIITSLCCAVGMLLVKRIFRYISDAERKRRKSERRILSTVLRTEEKERLRFSKELHDGLGPLLSSAKLSVSALSDSEMTKRDREIIENARYVIDEAIRSLREISVNLSPHVLNDFGLARAVSNFISKLPRSTPKIRFETNLKTERFDTDVEVILYRVICELINNSLKHAEASKVEVALNRKENILMVRYRDNGRGFDPAEASNQGMGLSNISSRISSLKGGLSITSQNGKGMEAQIDIPINE